MTLEDILGSLGPDPTILVERDPSCRMARIAVDGLVVMGGNYWDFYPGCHGSWHQQLAAAHGNYSNPGTMALCLQKAILSAGANSCQIMDADYRYVGR